MCAPLQPRHCEERSDEAIQTISADASLDCFAEPVIGPRFARTRCLTMMKRRAPPPTGEFLFKDIVLLCVCVVLFLASLPKSVVRLRTE